MDLLLIELLLWGGLLFLFWALKDGLGRVESEIESVGLFSAAAHTVEQPEHLQFSHPDQVREVIGTYRDAPIYRYAVIDGQHYQFDRICPIDEAARLELDAEERCLRPGLVYMPCEEPAIQPQAQQKAEV